MNRILKKIVINVLIVNLMFSGITFVGIQPKAVSAASIQKLKTNRCGRAFKIKDGMIYFEEFLSSDEGFGKTKRDYIDSSTKYYMATSDRKCKKISSKKAFKYIKNNLEYNLTDLRVEDGVAKVVVVGLERYVNWSIYYW